MAHKASIRIGRGVAIAPGCAFYPYDHGITSGTPIASQPLTSRGDIVVGDGAWLGTNVIVLSGVEIGRGAVIGAGSVVTRSVPEEAIAVGNPARVIGRRPTPQE
jgi:acetyltransferase-like isoleucine patch superfamily enzyme